MNYLSKNKVIHRDLALRNLLVTQTDGRYVIKVADFGLSRKTDNDYYASQDKMLPIKW